MRKDLTKETNIKKTINNLALSTFIGYASLFLLGVVDTLFLSHYSKTDLAASIIGSPFVYLTIALFIGIANSKQIFLSKLFKNKDANTQELSEDITKKTLIATISFLIIISLCLPELLRLINVDHSLLNKVYEYILINFIGVPFCIYNVLKQAYLRSIGNTKTPSLGMMYTTIINAILDPIFIFGFDMGLYGAALATIIAWMLTSSFFYYTVKKEERILLKNKISYKELNKLIPSMICNQIINPATTFITTIFINQHTINLINSYGVGQRFGKILVIIGFSFSTALMVYVGQNFNNKKKIEKSLSYCLKMTALLILITTILINLTYSYIGELFKLNAKELSMLSFYFQTLFVGSLFQGLYVINIGYMNVLNKHNTVLLVNLIKTFLLLPISLFVFSNFFGEKGIFIALVFQHAVSFFILKTYLVLTNDKKQINMLCIK